MHGTQTNVKYLQQIAEIFLHRYCTSTAVCIRLVITSADLKIHYFNLKDNVKNFVLTCTAQIQIEKTTEYEAYYDKEYILTCCIRLSK